MSSCILSIAADINRPKCRTGLMTMIVVRTVLASCWRDQKPPQSHRGYKRLPHGGLLPSLTGPAGTHVHKIDALFVAQLA